MKRKKENRATDELSVRSHRGLTDRSVPNRVFNDVKNRTTTPTTPVNNFKRSREMGKENGKSSQSAKRTRKSNGQASAKRYKYDTDVCSPTSALSIPVRSIFDRFFNDVLNSPRIPFTPVTSLNLSVANQSCKSGLTTVRHADSIDPRKRSRTVFNDITNISLEQENGTQVINKRPRKVNDNMKRSNPSPGETTDKEEESEEDDNFAIEGSHYVNEDQYFDCTTPENTDSESEVDSETENYDDHNVKKTEAERKQSVLSRMEALLQMAFTGRNSCAKQTS
ncbi:hypothetical protein IGI04_036641, partial [Brassica rapa subsp. trilocularis]